MDGSPLLTQTPAGTRIFYRERELYPAPPEATARTKAQSHPLAPETVYLLCSPLLWYGVSDLSARLPPSSRLILLETDPELFGLIDWQNALLRLPNAAQVILVPPQGFGQMLFRICSAFGRRTRRIQSIGLNAGRLLNQEFYKRLSDAAELELRRFWRNRSTLLFMARLWTRNLISNLLDNHPSRDISMHQRYRHVVVAGAGPSLDLGIQLLKECRSAYFLVAVDTAIPSLVRQNIIPDLIVAVEGQIANLRDFIPGGLDYPALAFDMTSSPLIPRHFRFDKLWHFVSEYAPGRHWDELASLGWPVTRIPPLGSVGVVALYLCRHLCDAHVHIIGLDFAWQAGATHAVDSPSQLAQFSSARRLSSQSGETASLQAHAQVLPGVGEGKPEYSDHVLGAYRDSLDEAIGMLRQQGLQVHDLRSRGLPLSAQPIKPDGFRQLLADDCPSPIIRTSKPEKGLVDQGGPGRVWLAGLVDRMAVCQTLIQHELRHPGKGSDNGQKILLGLEELDFLFLDIPDADWPTLDPGALTRALIILDYYRSFILQRF